MAKRPSNLTIIEDTNLNVIIEKLAAKDIFSGHFTNGTYVAPKNVVVPTTLAGFQHVVENESAADTTPLIIAINSEKSMRGIFAKKNTPSAERRLLENEKTRAEKVGLPLALQFPKREIAIIFYDEETPNTLYGAMRGNWFEMRTLYKMGYGTDLKAGIIEGAENFDKVYAHPLPNDAKPLCADITRKTGQEGKVFVVDLREKIGMNGKPYMTNKGACLFELNPKLAHYEYRPEIPFVDPNKNGFDHG